MSAGLFCAIGESLYGENWKSQLARELKVGERQIRRWANGEYEPPAGVWAELDALVGQRRADLDAVAIDLEGKLDAK